MSQASNTQLEDGHSLHHFSSDVSAGKTNNISASKLDGNFQLVKPRSVDGNLKHYTINQEKDGWNLEIFPKWPSKMSLLAFGITQSNNTNTGNAKLSWLALSDLAIYAPPSGTPGWREVERCDGKKMYVWGTEWE